jgi:hypothetical protein
MLTTGHNLSQDFLWKGYAVTDTTGKELNFKKQSFIKVDSENIYLFEFHELMSKKTGGGYN